MHAVVHAPAIYVHDARERIPRGSLSTRFRSGKCRYCLSPRRPGGHLLDAGHEILPSFLVNDVHDNGHGLTGFVFDGFELSTRLRPSSTLTSTIQTFAPLAARTS